MADLKRRLSKITEHNGQAPPGLAGTVESTHTSLGRQSLIMTQGHPDPKDEEAAQSQKGAGPGNGAGPLFCCSIKTEDGPPRLLSICISSICETSPNGTSFPQSEQQASLPSSVKWEFYKNLNKVWPEQSVLSWGEMREPWRGQDPGQWVREDLWESVVSVLRPEGVREPGGQVNGG